MKRPADPAAATLPSALRIVLPYAVFAGLWILLSDRAIALFFDDAQTLQAAGTLKGLLFVAVTSALLFFLVLRFAVHRAPGAPPAAPPLRRLRLAGSVALFSAVFVALAGGAVLQNREHHRAHQEKLLRSVAELQAAQIEGWLDERRRDAGTVRGALLHGRAWQAWRQDGDARAAARLRAQLEEFRVDMGYDGILVVDAGGAVLFGAGAAGHEAGEATRAAVQRAVAGAGAAVGDLFRMQAPAGVHLDFVAPLPAAGEGAADAAVVLRVDAEAAFRRLLQSWPVPSASAETLLFRRDGDAAVALNELRHRAQTALHQRWPFAAGQALVVQALGADYRPGALLAGVDYRDVPAIGIGRPIAGTDWWLLAKVDREEAFAAAGKDALWIGLSSLLAWFAAIALAAFFFLRLELRHAGAQRREQTEKLQALQLLEAIADSSTDAIFAKDTAGRYLLFNREVARLTGKTADEVLGHDDGALFPPEQAAMIARDDRAAMAAAGSRSFHETLDTVDGRLVFLATKGPLRDAEGKVFGTFGISRDITRMAQTEAALHREHALSQRYLDTVQTLMVALDRDGRVTMINRFGCALLGYAEEELIGRNWFEVALPQPDGLERFFPAFRRVMDGDVFAAEHFESPVRCRDGSERLMAWHNAVLGDESGRTVGTLSSGEDVSERRRAEDALRRQAEELAARNAELERFNRTVVGRELDMIALKRRVNALSVELGRAPPFALAGIDAPPAAGESS